MLCVCRFFLVCVLELCLFVSVFLLSGLNVIRLLLCFVRLWVIMCMSVLLDKCVCVFRIYIIRSQCKQIKFHMSTYGLQKYVSKLIVHICVSSSNAQLQNCILHNSTRISTSSCKLRVPSDMLLKNRYSNSC